MSHKSEKIGEIDPYGLRSLTDQLNEKFRIIQRLFDLIIFGELDDEDICYGSFYTSGANQTISVAASGTKYKVDGGFAVGQVKNTVFVENCGLKIEKDGKYLINWSLSLNTQTANDEIEAGLIIDEFPITPGNAKTDIQFNDEDVTLGSTAILDLNKDNSLFMYVENLTNTDDIVVNNGNMTIFKIGA